MIVNEQILQRYYDGDLTTAERAAVEQALRENDALQRELHQLRELGSLLREQAEMDAKAVGFEQMYRHIRAATERKSLAETLQEHWQKLFPTPLRWALPLSAVALLALAFVLLRPQAGSELAQNEVAMTVPAVQEPALPADVVEQDMRRSEVIEVDFGDNMGTVFQVEAAGGEQIAVLWVDEPEIEGSGAL